MAEHNPELQAKLRELEQELNEGEITTKGFQKRRTILFEQYGLSMGQPPQQQRQSVQPAGLRLHNPDDSLHPASDAGSRAASMAMRPRQSQGPGAVDQNNEMGNNAYAGAYEPGRLQVRNISQAGSHPHEGHHGNDSYPASFDNSSSPTMRSSNYAFNPENEPAYHPDQAPPQEQDVRQSTMLDQGYFSDFAGQQRAIQQDQAYGGPQRYSAPEVFSPSAAIPPPLLQPSELPTAAAINHLLPLEPRDFSFAVYDPHNADIPMSKFDNIAAVLRHRGRTSAKETAYWVLDQKGKEIASITWEKVASRAEKVAQVIRDKSNLYRGDRVALIYRDVEVIDFTVALLGCFIAGVVAVPINDLRDYAQLNVMLTTTQAHLALTSDTNLKNFTRMITENRLTWPRGVEWWKTNEFGSYHPKKKDETPALVVPDLAYIEFAKAPTGDLRGVVMSHRTIMHQMACLSAIIATVPKDESNYNTELRDSAGRLINRKDSGDILISYLDPRNGIGMIMGVLLAVYGGHTVVWMEHDAVNTPGLYASLISRYKASLMLADYPGLKTAVFNYQSDPMATRNFKKGTEPNFSNVRLCMIDTLTVDPEFHEVLADRWLRPLRNLRAREIVAPLLCLPEHGGMIIGMRDWLGGEERMGCPLNNFEVEEPEIEIEIKPTPTTNTGFSSLIGSSTSKPKLAQERAEFDQVLLDREALKTNEVVVLAIGDEAKKRSGEPGTLRIGAFGYPIPDATLAVVDPETSLLCTPHNVGELWVDSPSLSGGFWALPKHTETIFHARPYKFTEGNPTPMAVEPEFLRTGLLGTIIEGKIFVLGLYEDRLRQKVEWVEHGVEVAEHRYFFIQHLIITIMKSIPKIYDCSGFDVFVNDEHLPLIILESAAASTAPVQSGGPPRPLDTALLDSISERCMEVLYAVHHLRVYCVMITAPDTLPRTWKNGRREIGNMLCRRDFDAGALPCVHVKFGIERSVMNLPLGVDPMGGIWSPVSSAARQDILQGQEKQYSGFDYREVVIDDRTSTPLHNFKSITDLFQWRVVRQSEELALCTIDGRVREGKGITWKKFDQKVAAVAVFMQNKCRIKAGDHVILMYTHSEEFVYAVHACFCLGVIAIPMAPLDQNRLNEDAPAFLHLVGDYRVKAVLVNSDVHHLLGQKIVSQHIKQSAQVLRVNVPPTYNTTKPSKQNQGTKDLNLILRPDWATPGYPALIWTYWTPDQRRIAVQLGHDTIMGICKVQKETCQMTSSRPVVGCVRSTSGIGFVHSCLMGVFVGAPTYLLSPVDFASNPASLFISMARYKVKDTYATTQMLDHAMSAMPAKGFSLHDMKNLMIATESRPRLDVFSKVRNHFASATLDRTAINTIYSHVLNPMVATRSYMCIEPIELWLDTRALRRGLIYPVDQDNDPSALLIQDSGMVPVNTQIAIVNPETCQLCQVGEYGEIWVQSESCVHSFYGSKEPFDAERFMGRTTDGDPNVRYVRTGDLGFLHTVTRPIGPNGQAVEMQVLFVLGAVGETFEVNGLSHFPMDIEMSVEKCHRYIVPGGCAVFQAGGLIVILVEVVRKAYLAALVPVIVNIVLNEHQVIADIVAFVGKGDFPRSRLGEKQRGKILASWVTRKMRTIAQFNIRDPDAGDAQMIAVPEDRAVSTRGSTSINERPISYTQREQEQATKRFSAAFDPNYVTEQNLPYESSIVESPPTDTKNNYDDRTPQNVSNNRNDYFPTTDETALQPERPPKDYFAQPASSYDPEQTPLADPETQQVVNQNGNHVYDNPQYNGAGYDDYASTPVYAQQRTAEPVLTQAGSSGARNFSNNSFMAYHPGVPSSNGALSKVHPPPEPPKDVFTRMPSGRGGLRVANPASDDEEALPQEAILAMRRWEQ